MYSYKDLRLNLGLPQLVQEWKRFFSLKNFLPDVLAGTTVAFVAIPLSLAIALASGVEPEIGLVTAIIAGIVCALFGGTTLAVSGPAAAMSILIADTVQKFGLPALVFICLLAGIMQLISGVLGIGKLARYVPLPVISGFTAGIGVIIFVSQLPRFFGLMPPAESHIFDVFNHLRLYFHEMNGICFFIVILTFSIIRLLPKVLPKIPPILPAVIIATTVVYFFHLNSVPLIGKIPNTLPAPKLPLVSDLPWSELLFYAFTIYLLASLETLLSSSAIDKLAREKKHDSDQELIGQGLGNIAVSLFGGIPVSGVIVRSATNVKAGAKTRRSSIIHAILILATVYLIAPLISLIPIAALSGVLFSVALSMINYREFYDLWKTARDEAFIYAITFCVIIFVDLIAGVQAGIVAAALIVLWKATKTHLHMSNLTVDNLVRLSLKGSLTFLSIGKIKELEKELAMVPTSQIVILDLSDITNIDTSGATSINDLYQYCMERGIRFYIKGLPRRFESIFRICGGSTLIDQHYLISESELKNKENLEAPKSYHGRLLHGANVYHAERKLNDKRLFEFIAHSQDPHTLFITCSDSRIIPSLITSADPGELFIIRNVGNFIPPYQPEDFFSEAAALEFALCNLHITDIVICGHANCGAIKACQNFDRNISPKLKAWIGMIKSQLDLYDGMSVNEAARHNVLNQVNNLKKYPIVQEKLLNNALSIHAWFFDIDQSLIYVWNHSAKEFCSIVRETAEVY